jgi:cyclase
MIMKVECSVDMVTKHTVIGKTFINGRRQSNAGAVALNNYLVAIDPSPEAMTAKRFREAAEKELQLPTKYLLITHYHGDHTFGALAFQDTIILGSVPLITNMKRKLETEWSNKKDGIVFPEVIFTDELIIREDDLQVEIRHTGGHTTCSSYAYFPNEKVLFAGDLIFAEKFPWAGDPTCDPDQWIKVFEDFLKLDFEQLIPGHGPLTGREEVQKQLNHLRDLREATKVAIHENRSYTAIQRPAFYNASSESVITRTLQHFNEFYSNKKQTHGGSAR